MSVTARLKSFALQSKRVWHVLRKPTATEYKTVSKVSAIGILILGVIGFVIADLIRIVEGLFS